MYGGEGGIRSVGRSRTSAAMLCDYHAGAYGHALGHVRFTARSNPTFSPYTKKPTPFQESVDYSRMAERVGFEPTWACTLTVFKTAPL